MVDLIEFIRSFSIIGIVETWARSVGEFSIPDFTCFDVVRPISKNALRNSGGISVFVNNYILKYADVTHLKSLSNNVLWLLVTSRNVMFPNMLLGFVYMSPENSSIHSNESLFDIIENELAGFKNDYPGHSTFVLGDFNAYTSTNADYITLDDAFPTLNDTQYTEDTIPPPRYNSDQKRVNNYGLKLLQLCKSAGLRICNGRLGSDAETGSCTCFTDGSPSLIDYILSDMTLHDRFVDFKIEDRTESIHMPVWLEIKGQLSCPPDLNDSASSHDDVNFDIPKFKWDERKKDQYIEQIVSDLDSMFDSYNTALDNNDIFSALNQLTNCFANAGSIMTARNRSNKASTENLNSQRWFDSTCKYLRSVVLRKLRHFRLFRSDAALQGYKSAKNTYRETCRDCKSQFHDQERAKLSAAANSRNPKYFWNYLKNYSGLSRVNISVEDWYNYFHDLFNSDADMPFDDLSDGTYITDDTLDSQISPSEVSQAIGRLKCGKAAGIDGISAEFVKAISDRLVPILCLLYNKLYDNGIFPENWSTSIIAPILKKGNKHDPGNYRGISLLPILSKLFTDILNRRLDAWCTFNGLPGEEQGGFRRGYCTTDNIFSLTTIINKYLQKPRGRFYALFVDFEKAFDRINRQALFNKLASSSVSTKFLRMIKALYKDVKARVRTPTGVTDDFNCPHGVRQGCTLSPLLFSLFLNDLNEYISEGCHGVSLSLTRIFTLLYADDLVLVAESKIELQRMINRLKSYCDMWNLKINLQKTKVVVFRNGGTLRSYENWFYGNDKLEVTPYYKYLGLVFSSRFSWYMCQKTLADQATKAIFSLKTHLHRFGPLPASIMFKIFDTKIQPILSYGSEIWFTHEAKDIDTVHSKFCKYVLRINWSAPNTFVRGELGRYSMYCNRILKAIKYWFRVLRMNDNRLPAQCYKLQYGWAERNIDCWAYHIRHFLFTYGFGHVWISQGVGDISLFCNELKQRLHDVDIQAWRESLTSSSRLILYNYIKHDFARESYLEQIENPYYRSLIVKLRGGLLPLLYNTGFYTNTPIDQRLCPACSLLVEDEYHVIVICHKYSSLRRTFLPEILFVNPCHDKFVSILSHADSSLLISIARFLHRALENHNQY